MLIVEFSARRHRRRHHRCPISSLSLTLSLAVVVAAPEKLLIVEFAARHRRRCCPISPLSISLSLSLAVVVANLLIVVVVAVVGCNVLLLMVGVRFLETVGGGWGILLFFWESK